MYEQPSLLGARVVGPSLWPGWLADPDTAFQLARRDGNRVLFTYDVDGRPRSR